MNIKYQNERLRAKVEESTHFLRFFGTMILIALFFIFLSFYHTYKDIHNGWKINFNHLEGYSDIIRTVEINQMPLEISPGYYMVKVGNDALVMTNIDKAITQTEKNGHATVRGRMHAFWHQEDIEEAAEQYLLEHHYYGPEKAARVAHFYLDCSKISFMGLLHEDHPVGIIFGVTILIVVGIFMHEAKTLNLIKHLRPACGSIRYTPEEIDAQANSPDSIWLDDFEMYITPDIIIGTNKGMAAVGYDDIEKICVRSRWHQKADGLSKRGKPFKYRYKEYHTYQVVVKTHNNRQLIMCDSSGFKTSVLKEIIEERCGSGVWVDNDN